METSGAVGSVTNPVGGLEPIGYRSLSLKNVSMILNSPFIIGLVVIATVIAGIFWRNPN